VPCPCGYWPSQRIISGLHCQGNFRGGIEKEEREGGGDRRGQSSSSVPVLRLCFGVLPSLDSRRGRPLSLLLPGLHRKPRLALSSNSAGRNYFTQVWFAANLPPPLLVALFVFRGCKSPNLIWLPALRTTGAAAPAAAAQA
jgi:hypothetical protein